MKDIIMFGTKISASCAIIPKYRKEETDIEAVPVKKGTRHTTTRGKRRVQKAAHKRRDRSHKEAHWNHAQRIAYGRGMWSGVNEDDIRYRREQEKKVYSLQEVTVIPGQWWNIYLGKKWYNLSQTVRFFGTEEEAIVRLKALTNIRGFVGFCEPMDPTNEIIDQMTGEIVSDYDYNSNWEDWLDYSEEESRSDFGKVLSRSIGYEFDFGYVMTVNKKR